MTTVSLMPTARAAQRHASLAAYGISPLAIVAFWWLRKEHMIASTSMVTLAIGLVIGGLANYGTSVWLRALPTSRVRIHARVAASALMTAAVVYSTGWGPLVLVAFAVGSAELLRLAGPVTSGPNLVWNFVGVAAGQIAIEAGWAPSIVETRVSHAIAITGIVCLAAVTRMLGQSARATERAESLVRERALHFEALIAHASDLIGVISPEGVIRSMSPSVEDLLGYTPDQAIGQPVAAFVDPEFAEHVTSVLASVVSDAGAPRELTFRLRHQDGSDRLVMASLTKPTASSDDGIIVNIHDITTQHDLEEQLRHDAQHDALTGLLNRKAFSDVSARACARAARHGRTVGMLYIDLDGFKQINDSFGHDAGDRVLVEASVRLDGCLRRGETLARLGGDEFAVMLDVVEGDEAITVAERILDALSAPIPGLPDDARVGASIGIALRSSEGIEISNLMRDADEAMYVAKRNGRSRWELSGSNSDQVETSKIA